MFYKIVSEGQIIDVCDGLTFVRWQRKNGIFLICNTEADADGILSSNGSTIYLLEGKEQVKEGLNQVHYAEIDEDTYKELLDELIKNGMLDDPSEVAPQPDTGDTGDDTPGTTEPVAKSEEMKLIESLQAQVEMLVECVLELSEIAYA